MTFIIFFNFSKKTSLDISCESSAKHEISRLVFFEKLKKKYFKMLSAAVVIGTLRVKQLPVINVHSGRCIIACCQIIPAMATCSPTLLYFYIYIIYKNVKEIRVCNMTCYHMITTIILIVIQSLDTSHASVK